MDLIFGAFSGGNDHDREQTASETITKLCDRALNSSLLEDRRGAILGLRGLAKDWQLEVGTKGMPALLNVLKNDRMDIEITKAALETLNLLCTRNKKQAEDLGGMLTEIFIKDHANVALLLDILAEVDFYVRFNCVSLLTTLLNNATQAFQDAVLVSPMGISRLIDLLDDHREIIRNEGLLLLISLTNSNADIQKIIAFENAFERLFAIILEEGATDGGIIVQDCLQLMQNLLRYNVSNQNLFRETSCIHHIPTLLVTKNDEDEIPITMITQWSDQKITNTCNVFSLIRILVGPNTHNTFVNQNVLAKLIPELFQVAAGAFPETVRASAMYTVSDLVRNHDQNQEKLLSIVVKKAVAPSGLPNQKSPPGIPTKAIDVIIHSCLDKEALKVRCASCHLWQSILNNNPEQQIKLVTSPAMEKLGSALLDLETSKKDPYKIWFGANLLMHCLFDNADARNQALSFKKDDVALLQHVTFTILRSSQENMDLKIQVSLLSLLAVWMYDSIAAVKEFLSEGSNVQYLVEQINQATGVDIAVQGLCCFLLAILYQFNDDSEPVFSRQNIQNLVLSRIGSDVYLSKLPRFKESKSFNSCTLEIYSDDVLFDYEFIEFFKLHADLTAKNLTNLSKSKRSPSSKMAETEMSRQIQQQQQQIKTLQSQVDNNSEVQTLKQTVASLEKELKGTRKELKELQSEHEDLLLCLADQEEELLDLKQRLRNYGEKFPDDEDYT